MFRTIAAALLGVALLAPSDPALADLVTSTLTLSDPSAGIGTGPFGTVTLTQAGPDSVDVTVTLDTSTAFVSTGGPHNAFAFNLDVPLSSVTITGLTTGFTNEDAGVTNTPFGSYTDGISCPSCGPGASHAFPGPLSFVVTDNSGLTLADFVANGDGDFFSSDVIGPAGGTGNVASDSLSAPVPEPDSLLLFASALLILGFFLHRARHRMASPIA